MSRERNHNLAQAEKISIFWLIQIDAILDLGERVYPLWLKDAGSLCYIIAGRKMFEDAILDQSEPRIKTSPLLSNRALMRDTQRQS